MITRRGGVIQEVNRTTVRELEKYCRVEARGLLGYPSSRQTCCQKIKSAHGCPICAPGQRATRNESLLPFHMRQYLPAWAKMPEPPLPQLAATKDRDWRCLHPLCTGHEPDRWP